MAAGKVVISVTPELDPYYPVQEIRVSLEVRDASDELTDPGALTLFVRKPDETEYQITIGSLVHDSTGRYHYDALLDMSYSWQLRVESSGPVASDEFPIAVAGSVFDTAVDPPVGPGTGHEGEIAKVIGGSYQPYAGDADERPLVWRTGVGWISQALNLAAAAAVSGLLALTHIPPGTDGQVLVTSGTTVTWASGGGGGGIPGGATEEVQYNLAGAFAGASQVKMAGAGTTEHGLRFYENGGWGGTPPTSGALNFLSNSNMLVMRNAADSANIVLLATGTTDVLRVGAAGLQGYVFNTAAGTTYALQHNSVTEYSFSSSALTMQSNDLIMGSGAITIGGQPATTGSIRGTYATIAPFAELIAVRNSANTDNVTALSVGTFFGQTDSVKLGGANANLALDFKTGGLLSFQINGTQVAAFTSIGFNMGGLSVQTAAFFSGTGTVSTVGLLRGSHGFGGGLVSGRNAADSGDISLIRWGIVANDRLTIGDSSVSGTYSNVATGGSHVLQVAASDEYNFTSTALTMNGNNVVGGGFYSGSGTVATSGLLRGANNSILVSARNAADSTNVSLLSIQNDDAVVLGDSANTDQIIYKSVSFHTFQLAGSTEYLFSTTGLTMNNNNLLMGSGFISLGSSPASSGALRMSNNTGLFQRNGANSGDRKLIAMDNSDVVSIGDTSVSGITFAIANGFVYDFTTSSGTGGVSIGNSSMSLRFGGTAASGSGDVRVRQGFSIFGRNNAGSGDQGILDYGSTADRLIIGGSVGSLQFGSVNTAFFAGTPAAKQTVTGSRGGNAALASLLTALATYGLLTDSSS